MKMDYGMISNMAFMALCMFLLVAAFATLLAVFVVIKFYLFPKSFPQLQHSCLYYGRVKHTRLKGGAIHHLDYPLFFSYLDLAEIQKIGWSLWPIFAVNKPLISFCSFDYNQHLKDYTAHDPSVNNDLLKKVYAFMQEKTKYTTYDHVQILTHLSYFGYCFNPISIYYLKEQLSDKTLKTEAVIAEVSNTPWIEMHTYPLHPTTIQPSPSSTSSIDYSYHYDALEKMTRVKWLKKFHVSPFMEMDYYYDFQFYEPTSIKGATRNSTMIRVTSKLIKISTKETWFTASFELQSIPFTPLNLLFVLLYYPLHTRMIQLYIHIEAIKLFWKGVPTFEHPQGTDVDFGYGITGKRIGMVLWWLIQPVSLLYSGVSSLLLSSKRSREIVKDKSA